jgi:hypothetical protein
MLESIPLSISGCFILTTIATIVFFVSACRKAGYLDYRIPGLIALLLLVQGFLAFTGFFSSNLNSFPPRLPVLVFPSFLAIILAFLLPRGRKFIDSLPMKNLLWLHVVRIPVELVLYGLFVYKAVPELMTFEGRNPDILSGITAPFVVWRAFRNGRIDRKLLIFWNVLALGLLINIVANAVLSAPFAFQKFAFDQPNTAVLYFPFCWLPGIVVPLVFFSHLVSLRQLILIKDEIPT